MESFLINIPKSKTSLVKALLKELGVTVKALEGNLDDLKPNRDTLAAMNEIKAGKGLSFSSVDNLFDSIK